MLKADKMRDKIQEFMETRAATGKTPFWELEFHCFNAFSGKHLCLGQEFQKQTAAEQDRALGLNAEIITRVTEELGFTAVTVPGLYWEAAPGHPAYYWLPPDSRMVQVRRIRAMMPKSVTLVGSSGGVMAMPNASIYMEFAYQLFDAPEEIDARAQKAFQEGCATAARLKEAGVDAVFTASDLSDNRGPYFNPEQMERFILPFLRKWAVEMRRLELYGIIHTDGNIMPVLEDIANSGVRCIQAVDPTAGMDMAETGKKADGRVALAGNVDCGLLLAGRPEEVYEYGKKLLLGCKDRMRLIYGTSNAVQMETPKANYEALVRAWREHG